MRQGRDRGRGPSPIDDSPGGLGANFRSAYRWHGCPASHPAGPGPLTIGLGLRAPVRGMEGTTGSNAPRIVNMSTSDIQALRPAIMLVDDSEPYMHVMSSVLQGCGLEVHMAKGAQEALVMLDQVTPDLILLDVMMPEVDGIRFLCQLRGDPRLQVVPVVIVTAYPDTRQEAIDAGADGFLAKPFTTQQLRAAIAEFLQVGPIR